MNGPSNQDFERLEGLLRAAAEYEPARPAPMFLAARALAFPFRRPVNRRAVSGFGAALTMAAAAAAAFILRSDPQPALSSFSREVRSADSGTGLLAATEQKEEKADSAKKPPEKPAPRITDAFERRRIPLDSRSRRPRSKRTEKIPPPVIARAEITEETVHVFEAGIIAPVLLSTVDEESGATVMQASMIEMPIERREVVMPTGYDTSYLRSINNEETP